MDYDYLYDCGADRLYSENAWQDIKKKKYDLIEKHTFNGDVVVRKTNIPYKHCAKVLCETSFTKDMNHVLELIDSVTKKSIARASYGVFGTRLIGIVKDNTVFHKIY